MKVAILYASMSGNTKLVSDIIEKELIRRGCIVSSVNLHSQESNLEELVADTDILLIGSYTWGNGKLPARMRKFLSYHLKDNKTHFPMTFVFGTGETQWMHYCRAVDEIKYHLKRHSINVQELSLKIEQSPLNGQENKVLYYIDEIMKEIDKFELK
ncbi:flavodoxin [Paenibacillaceae bacterium]|nr:flavodoxin [Paenibacillaceae bacterium]